MHTTFENALMENLACAGVNSEATIMVHSAFKRLGKLGGAAEKCCEALLEYAHGGTVLMPTMTWRTVHAGQPHFYSAHTPSHTGILSEVFRTKYASCRSLHPTHSVAAAGKYAMLLTDSHHVSDSPCSITSPYGKIVDSDLLDNFYILLINVGLESCTFVHYFEEKFASDLYLEKQFQKFVLHPFEGDTVEYCLRSHKKITRDFHQFGYPCWKKGGMKVWQYQGVDMFLVRGKTLAETVEVRFNHDPEANLARASYTRFHEPKADYDS